MFIPSMSPSAFEKSQNILKRSLQSLNLRYQVLSNNVANASTPNFKRSDVTFYETLHKAIQSQENPYRIESKKTQEVHRDFYRKIDPNSVKPKIFTEYYSSIQNNGNNVDIELENTEIAKTALAYEATSQMLSRNYKLLKSIIK